MVDIAFFGSHPLGKKCLRRLTESRDVDVRVVVAYERDYDGWWDGSANELARELGHDILTTEDESRVWEYDIDYLLSVYYPNILPPEILDHPSELALNLHQAELPRYWGSNVFSHAIMNARDDDHWVYGTTVHVMAEDVDAGDVVDREFVDITERDTARSLYEKTCAASITLFERVLPKIVLGAVHEERTPQSAFDGERYFYSKDSLDGEKHVPPEAISDPGRQTELYDKIRALDFPPHEPAYTEIGGNRIYLTRSSYEDVADFL